MAVAGLGVALLSGACSLPQGTALTRAEVASDYSNTQDCNLGGQSHVSVDDLGLVSPWVREIESGSNEVRHQANDDLVSANVGVSHDRVAPAPRPKISRITASAIAGHPGFVWSPFAGPDKPVDVRKFAPGAEALCPYTMKSFTVPAKAAAAPIPLPVRETVIEPPSLAAAGKTAQPLGQTGSVPDGGTSDTGDGAELPVGTWVDDKPGFVLSPYARKFELVEVEGRKPGEVVKCPYSGKFFKLPLSN